MVNDLNLLRSRLESEQKHLIEEMEQLKEACWDIKNRLVEASATAFCNKIQVGQDFIPQT